MMLCQADFEELFPETFAREEDDDAPAETSQPSQECDARQESDESATCPIRSSRAAAVNQASRDAAIARALQIDRPFDPMGVDLALATLPALTTALAMMAALDSTGRN